VLTFSCVLKGFCKGEGRANRPMLRANAHLTRLSYWLVYQQSKAECVYKWTYLCIQKRTCFIL